MKKLFFFSVLIISFTTASSFAELFDVENVIKALKSGNARELSNYVDDNIEISLPTKTDLYSRGQALMILQDFFSNNEVKNFLVKHTGNNSGNHFCIGVLQTGSGSYRTTFFMITKKGKQILREIRFQPT